MKTRSENNTKNAKIRRMLPAFLSLLLVLSLLLGGCGSSGKDSQDTDQSSAGTGTEQAAQSSGGSGDADSDGSGGDEAGNGADEQSQNDSGQSGSSESADNTWSTTFTDDCDRKTTVPKKIENVIASGNLAQIMLFAIAPDTLMAVNGSWSEEAAGYIDDKYLELPEVGSFFGNHDLNYEEIAKLSPDIIIDVGEDKPSMEADLEDITSKTGIPAVHISADYDNMDEAFLKLGELLGCREEGKALADFCSNAVSLSDKTIKAVKKKKTLMYCTQEDGLNVIAYNSYHSQIIDWLSENVAKLDDPSSQGTGNEVNLEQMMLWDPEVILFAPGSYYDYVADDPAWSSLTAIRTGKYYEVPSGPYNWMGSPPSSNRILGMLWMGKLLYPKQADYDMKKLAKEYYAMFYHHKLTDKEYASLVKNSLGTK